MRVFVEPTGLHSRAMIRVAGALKRFAPAGVRIVQRPSDADLQVLHVISPDAIEYAAKVRREGRQYAVIQYCTHGGTAEAWSGLWDDAVTVLTYYTNLAGHIKVQLHPLGIDPVFLMPFISYREKLVVTHGYVHGRGAEAILEVWQAAKRLGFNAIHVGPDDIEGMPNRPPNWHAVHGLTDEQLARLFRRAAWVACMRYVEGFEMPAIEALSCGARPIVFDQPSMRFWYGDFASYVPELDGPALVDKLVDLMSFPRPVSPQELAEVRRRFAWEPICRDFWNQILHILSPVHAEQATTAASSRGILDAE